MSQAPVIPQSGNRCGHDPKNPQLSPPTPIKKGPGGLPRILSLATEKAKAWFHHPDQCPDLQSSPHRQTRSERREAIQVVLEALLGRLDLASLCVGVPTPTDGFIDVDMKTIVQDTGLGQRRCERAIGQLKTAGFLTVEQPRHRNEAGAYIGLRAIRVFTKKFFDWLGLGPMLVRERERATKALRRKATQAGKSLSDVMRRLQKRFKPAPRRPAHKPLAVEKIRAWNHHFIDLTDGQGIEFREAQRQTNQHFGYPANWSPGMGMP
jgi:hypothetical protein